MLLRYADLFCFSLTAGQLPDCFHHASFVLVQGVASAEV